ncbi:hypothetical protein J5893_03470 [bacterium]|nr:hypothetical protein [bacterium]
MTGTASSTTIEILPNNETEQLKNTTYEQKLVTGTPVVSVDRKKIALYETGSEQINILLTNDATASFRKNVILQIQDAQGHVVGVDSDVRIRSAQQLLRVGNQFSDGSFSSTTVFRLSKGLLSFSLDSLKQAGEDLVIIEIPGLDPIYLTVLVQAAPAFKVSTVFPVEKMQVGEQLTGFLTITDLWGNLVSSATNIQLTITKNLQVGSVAQQTRILMITGSKEISVRGTEAGIGYLMGQVMSNPDARPDYVRITVSDALLPQTGLNVMYLNYFGSDW